MHSNQRIKFFLGVLHPLLSWFNMTRSNIYGPLVTVLTEFHSKIARSIWKFGIVLLSHDCDNWARLYASPITKRGKVELALIYVDSVMDNSVVLQLLNHTGNLWRLLYSGCRISVVESSLVLFYETAFRSYHSQKQKCKL